MLGVHVGVKEGQLLQKAGSWAPPGPCGADALGSALSKCSDDSMHVKLEDHQAESSSRPVMDLPPCFYSAPDVVTVRSGQQQDSGQPRLKALSKAKE